CTVDRQRGPFALWRGTNFVDGSLRLKLSLNPASETAAILFRSTAVKDEQLGSELLFDARQRRVSVRRQTAQVEVLGEAPLAMPLDKAIPVHLEFAGNRIQVFLGEASEAVLDVTDAGPVLEPGYVGVRCSGAPIHLDELVVKAANGSNVAVLPDASSE